MLKWQMSKVIKSNKKVFFARFVSFRCGYNLNQMSNRYFSPDKCRIYINQLNTITKFNVYNTRCFVFIVINIRFSFEVKRKSHSKCEVTIRFLVELS